METINNNDIIVSENNNNNNNIIIPKLKVLSASGKRHVLYSETTGKQCCKPLDPN